MFLKTSVHDGHSHLVYWNEKMGGGLSSEDNSHIHPIIMSPDGAMQVGPSTSDNHIHLLEDQKLKRDPTEKDKEKVVGEVIELFKACQDLEREGREKAQESEDFYSGDQWDKSTKEMLSSKMRAALTINHCEPMVDLLCGYQRQNRQDIKFFPVEGGDSKTATMLTALIKNLTETMNLTTEESLVFEDMVIGGRGGFHLYVDWDTESEPQLRLERFPVEDFWLGPSDRPDQSDMEVMHKARWFSLDKAKQLWPEQEDNLSQTYDITEEDGKEPHLTLHGNQYNAGNYPSMSPELFSIARKEVRVIECWRKEYFSSARIFLPDGSVEEADKWFPSDIRRAKKIQGIRVESKPGTKIRKTTIAGSVLLDDEYPDLPKGVSWPIDVAYAKKRKNKWWGKVESAKDPQRQINKGSSQIADILNKVSAYGWFYDQGTFPSNNEKEAFKKNSTSPGFVIEVSDSNRIPKQTEGVRFPTESASLVEMNIKSFREVTTVSMEWINSSGEMSGSSLIERRRTGMAANEFLYDNLAQTKRRLAKNIVAWVQKLYGNNPEKIARILLSAREQTPGQIPGQAQEEFSIQDIQQMLMNMDLTRYDVIVGESKFSPSMRRAAFESWSELAGRGVQVPPKMLVDLSDLPEKEKVSQMFDAQAQAQQQAENQKSQMELGKTLIAKGINPQSVLGGQGGQPPQ